MLINFILLFNRKKKWALSKYRWYFVLSLSILGVFIYILTNDESLDGRTKLAIWGLLTPLIFTLINVAFRNYSKQLHNRDLYLWLRDSNDIDDSKLSGTVELLIKLRKEARENKDFALSDKIRDELIELGIQLKDGREGTTFTVN